MAPRSYPKMLATTDSSLSPEKCLMAAVLTLAIEDATAPKPVHIPLTPEMYETYLRVERGRKTNRRKTFPSFDDYEAERLYRHRDKVRNWARLRDAALAWIASNEDRHIFSFVSVCANIDIGTAIVRKRVAQCPAA